MKEPAHRALQPFEQIPTYAEDDLVLFESGAIVFHIAQRHVGLLDEYPNLAAYVSRAEARPAFKRAFAAQLAVFTGTPSTGR